jgi:hypothetical protein
MIIELYDFRYAPGIHWFECREAVEFGLYLSALHANGSTELLIRKCNNNKATALVTSASVLVRFVKVSKRGSFSGETGFKLSFTFHPYADGVPEKSSESGLFRCSTPLYASFRQHLHCKLQPECEGGEDEGAHCPYSNTQCAGRVASDNKCYQMFEKKDAGSIRSLEWMAARELCRQHGGQLATMKTSRQWQDLAKLYTYGKASVPANIGLRTADTHTPDMYKQFSNGWTGPPH